MDSMAAKLAGQRLAPTQCLSWGHPVTSGFPTLDYFLSSELMEPANGHEHYTEQLVTLPKLSIYYEPLLVRPIVVNRGSLGLRPTATVYWCGQSLFKYLPQHDQVFARIAHEIPGCQFAFFESPIGTHITDLFRQRLELAFAEFGLNADDYCVFMPPVDLHSYVATFGQCDVFLDSIDWSGANTTLESLAHDLPIVTFEGALMRGRHSMAILKRMGITETIAKTLDEYVSIAVRLGRDIAFRASVKSAISKNKHRVYRDHSSIVALESSLRRLHGANRNLGAIDARSNDEQSNCPFSLVGNLFQEEPVRFEFQIFDIAQPLGMFSTLTYCILLARACEEKGIEPYVLASSPFYLSPARSRSWPDGGKDGSINILVISECNLQTARSPRYARTAS